MAAVRFLLIAFSYLYEGLLALFLTAVAALALASHTTLHLEMLPWTGSTLDYVLVFGGLCGVVLTLLAIVGKLRPLFFVWVLAVFVMMIRGYVFSGYHFDPTSAKTAAYLLAGALLGLIGGLWQMFRPRSDRRF